MKKISKILFVLVTSSAILTSCNKEDIEDFKGDTSSVGASTTIDAANTMDVQTGIQYSSPTLIAVTKMAAPKATDCATVSSSGNNLSYPKVFTVDYGTGCTTGLITRKGKLKITVSAPINETGSKMTIERIDYSINGRKLEGTIDYVNTTTDAKVPQWTRTIKNGRFTDINGNVFLNLGNCTVRQTGGVDTPYDLEDNIYEMTQGQHTVTNGAGKTLTLTVLETLVKKYSCEYISKGKLSVVGGILDGVVDYGNNDCDNDYSYTHKNGQVYQLKM